MDPIDSIAYIQQIKLSGVLMMIWPELGCKNICSINSRLQGTDTINVLYFSIRNKNSPCGLEMCSDCNKSEQLLKSDLSE